MSKTFTLNLDLNAICEILDCAVLCDPPNNALHKSIVDQIAADPEGAAIVKRWARADREFNRNMKR